MVLFVDALAFIAAAAASIAAWHSASSAKSANEYVREVELRGLIRDASMVANNVIAESMRVDELGNQLIRDIRSGAIFTGTLGGSRTKMYIDEVNENRSSIGPMQQEARKFLQSLKELKNFSQTNLTAKLCELEGNLTQIRRVKEKFHIDLASTEADNRLFQSEAIKND